MAPVKGKVKVKGKPGRPKSATSLKPTGKPVVTFMPPKLHARVRLACIALSTNASSVIRDLLTEWVTSKKKEIAAVINMKDDVEEEEEEETEEEGEEEEEEEE